MTFWPDARIFDETEFRAQTIIERLQVYAFLNAGLDIRFKDERPGAEQASTRFQYRGRHHRLRSPSQRVQGGAVQAGGRLHGG